MRYTKYDTQGACHWNEYARKRNYKDIVDSSLLPFKGVKKGTLIDIGCGDGVSSCFLAKMGFEVTGVEIEPLGIKYAKEMCKEKVNWICEDAEHISTLDAEFDYLYSMNTIEHLKKPEIMVDLMKKVKKFGIIVTDDSEVSKKGNDFHEKEFNREEFKELFKDFKLEEIPMKWYKFFGYKITK